MFLIDKKAEKIVSGLGWSISERLMAQGVTFVVSIILARLLEPEEYGVLSLVLVFINLANVFISNGFGEALIQRKEVEDDDFSSIFWCAFSFAVVIYVVLLLCAPLIGDFYNDESVPGVLRILALMLPITSINTIQHAYVSRNMQFKKFFFSTLAGSIVSGGVGIVLAYKGFGVWALVAQTLLNSFVDTIVLLFIVKWYPRFVFKLSSAKALMSYAWKATGASFINALYGQARALIIGKVYSTADLAYYNKGDQFPTLFIANINTSICNVTFPVMASLQENPEELKRFTRRILKITTFIVFPLLIGLMGVANELVIVLLTEKWLPCVPFMQILCIYWMAQPIQSINWQLLKAMGRSDLCLKLEVIKKIIGFALVAMTMFISVEALTISTTAFAIISMVINIIPNKKLVGYSFSEQIMDILPNLLLAAGMGIAVFLIGQIELPAILVLCAQVLTGIAIYVAGAILFKIEAWSYCLEYLSPYLSRFKHR